MAGRASLLVALALAAPVSADVGAPLPDAAARAPRAFRCDGTDAFFFDELNRAGTVGYGETWDAAVCNEGAAVFAEGDRRWRDLRRTRRPVSQDEQALAMVVPLTLGGGLTLIVGAAALLGLVTRLRRRTVLEAPCPSCTASLPVEASEGGTQLFCPMCGAACAIVVQGRGRAATAHASPLR